MAKSKFFRAFVSGATISDGRVITDQMIDDVLSTFNAETYTPRINVEHLSGYIRVRGNASPRRVQGR